jgi:energy-coupling factor transporter ATP-binding protein EcfA2
MKVHIQNYQSVADVTLEVEGLTVVVGKSNIGKSALIRAIKGALYNGQGDKFVRDGAEHAEVHIQTEDLDLTWKKGGPYNGYVINGAEFQSVGRGAPDPIAKAGFYDLEVANTTLPVQFADQFHPLFLLDGSGAVAAEAISDIDRLAELQEALRLCDKDKREDKATLKVRKRDVKDVAVALESFDTFEHCGAVMASLEQSVNQICELEAAIQRLQQWVGRCAELQEVMVALEGVGDVLLPEDEDSAYLRSEVAKLQTYVERRDNVASIMSKYSNVGDIILPPEWDNSLREELHHLSELYSQAKRHAQVLKQGKLLVNVDLPEHLNYRQEHQDLQQLQDLHLQLVRARDSAREAKQVRDEVQVQMQELQQTFDQCLTEAGVCPLCEQGVHS